MNVGDYANQLWQLTQPLLVLFGAYLTARFAFRAEQRRSQAQTEAAQVAAMAQRETAEIQGETSVGQLAFNMAKDAKDEAQRANAHIARLDRWRRRLEYQWWPQHERVDQAVLQELEKLDPGVIAHLPEPPVFPAFDETERRSIDWLSTSKRKPPQAE